MQICGLPSALYRLYNLSCKMEDAGTEALKRLEILKKWKELKESGAKDNVIANALEVSRATLYRYQRAFKKDALLGLKPKSRCPKRIRESKKITPPLTDLVRDIRTRNLTYGKLKIQRILERDEDEKVSASTVGRILKKLIDKGQIKRVTALKRKRKRVFTGHAQRWTGKEDRSEPGRMVQIDHMTTTIGTMIYKEFHAWDPKTKMLVSQVYCSATSLVASKFLEFVLEKFPFKVESIQVDGGTEFMKHFEKKAEEIQIPLLVLPPKSPKYNGGVERSNRVVREEFYALHTDDISSIHELRNKLQWFVNRYNTYRPHNSLNGLTPMEYYKTILEAKNSPFLESQML
jgi:putative transposase